MKWSTGISSREGPSAHPAHATLDVLPRVEEWPDQTKAERTAKVIRESSLAAGSERGHSVVHEMEVEVRDWECRGTGPKGH